MKPTGDGDRSTGTVSQIRQQDPTDAGMPSIEAHAAVDAPRPLGVVITRPPKPKVVPPSVTVVVPAPAAPVGTPFNMSIQANEGTDWVWDGGDNVWEEVPAVAYQGGFSLQFDTGETASSSSLATPASVTLNRAGIHIVTGSAPTTTGPVIHSSPTQIIAAKPTLTVTAPAEQNPPISIPLAETGADVTITATSTTPAAWFGGLTVTAQSSQNRTDLAPTDAGGTSWQGMVHLDPMPLGNRSITVVASAKVAPQLACTVVCVVSAADAAPPHLVVSHPPSGGKIVVDASLKANLNGTCNDTQSGMFGGRASVEVALSSSGPFTAATPNAPGDFTQWSATVTAPDLGPFVVYLRATDAAGNISSIAAWPLEAISDYVPATLADRLSDTEYLSALMAFARDTVTRPGGQVTSADLTAALQQPVDRMSQPLSAAAIAGQVPVNELRVPAEILRSYIAASNIATGQRAAGEAAYLSAAYQALLAGVGTSYAELRLARGADSTTRQALAGRLGINLYGVSSAQPRPDQLDTLTLDGPALTEAALETLFGLPATTAGLDPLRTILPPQMLSWRITAQQGRWQAEDAHPPVPVAYTVIADPDIITTADLQPGAPGQVAAQVGTWLADRGIQLSTQASTLQGALANANTATAQLAALLSAGLPSGTDIAALQAQDVQGADISGQLTAAGLDRNGFTYLVQLQAVASAGLVNSTEWAAAVDVLVGTFRRRQYATWAADEAQQPTPVVLSPDNFQLTGTGPGVSGYRIDPRARADWQATLRTRTIERQALTHGMTGLVATTEQATLGILRDRLLFDVAAAEYNTPYPSADDTSNAAAQLAGRYQVDFTVKGSRSTTRLAQATGSLQALLLLIRSGDNTSVTGSPVSGWTLTNPEAAFDAAWAWMGTEGSWQSATTAFLFPEAALDPSLLQQYPDSSSPSFGQPDGCSPAFQDLLTGLAESIGPPDTTSSDGPLGQYLQSIQAPGPPKGILASAGVPGAGDQLTYLKARSITWQEQLASWCGQLTTDGDLGLAREVFWAVPMLIGQRLHAAGEYQAALDWYWVVYPYNATRPVSSYDMINTELATSSPLPPDLTFPPDWTSRLNPFQLVWSGTPPYPYARPYTWIRNTLLAIVSCLVDYADSEFSAYTAESVAHARDLYATATSLLAHPGLAPVQPSSAGEPKLPIPQLQTLATRVAAQLGKLRQDRDIAGLPQTQAVSTGNPLSQPTPYHFKILLARAQQLAQQAATIETEYLSALEKYDNKTLQVSDAQNAASVAALQLGVHAAQVQEATDAVTVAAVQQTKATTMITQYNDAINASPNQYEQALLSNYGDMRSAQDVIAGADAAIGIAQAVSSASAVKIPWLAWGAGVAEVAGVGVKAAAQIWVNNLQAQAQADQLQASIEDRKQQWQIELASANQDALIAAAQVTTADDQKTIALAEQTVATAQNQQAQATLALLTTQFTNPDLYKWMSGTLGGVYRYFLQQATATARLAQAQLAFERAEPAQTLVRVNYWQPPAQLAASPASAIPGA